jgi:putative ABC transport system permease protein
MSFRRTIASLIALMRRRQLDRELENEIHSHLELAERDAVARGLSPEEASREARRSFGGIEQMKEEHRDRRSFRWIETLFRDFRNGLASLRRAPGFTVIIVGVLALGIGGTVATFSVVDAVLLKPLPFRDSDRIVRVWAAPRPGVVNATTVPQFLAWKRLSGDFDALSAEQAVQAALNDKGGPARLLGKEVTADYFKVFATGTELGRTFTSEDDRPGVDRVLVLSHAAWQTYFGGDPAILDHRVFLDGETFQVIGILKPGASDRDETQFWKPLVFTPEQSSNEVHWLTVYGRLRAGTAPAQARERMEAIQATLVETATRQEHEGIIAIEPLARLLVSPNLRRSISVAFGAVLLVLLIACANVANLLFAQGAARRTELAVRAALGAGRGRLVAQLLTESFALCLVGGAAGVATADLLIRAAIPLLSQSLPFTADVSLNPRVFAFGATVVLGVVVIAGALPALQASFGDLTESLKQSARGSSGAHIRVRRTIVIGEVALSLVLVCGALLLLRSLLKLQQLDTGIRVENVITMSADLPVQAYPTREKAALFYEAVAQRLRSVPGVRNVGVATHLPLQWIDNGEAMQVAGVEKLVRVRFKRVDPGYFSTLGIPVLTGRGITNRDRDGSPRVVVINQALVTRLADVAGMKDPVGKLVRLSSIDYVEHKPLMTEVQIAGIIRSERTASPGDPDPAVVYVPLAQAPSPHVKFLVRTQEDAAAVMPAIREAVREIDPNLPLADVATMQQVRDHTLSGASRPAWLIGVFAVIAVFLAAIGVYGVISYSVTQQRREIGIRIALGARPSDVLSDVLGSALTLVIIGLVLGLTGAVALTRVMKGLLFELSPLDPAALAIACVSMVLIGLFAGFFPAHRASRLDPVVTLRDEG